MIDHYPACFEHIAYHIHDALKAGATRAEVAETVGVAVVMGGAAHRSEALEPAEEVAIDRVVYGCQALEAMEGFAAVTSLDRPVDEEGREVERIERWALERLGMERELAALAEAA